MTYKTYESAERRVFLLIRSIGAWPGIVRKGKGYVLTYDPPGVTELNAHGYLVTP